MKSATMTKFVFITCLVIGLSFLLPTYNAFAQDASPAALTETPAPATPTNTTVPTATNTPVPGATATNTPLPGATATPTNTPVGQPPTPVPSRPVPIPEPVTVVLFGTALAALSAAVASRRKKDN